MLSILPMTIGHIGAIDILKPPSSFETVSTTSNISEANVILLILVVDTPVSLDSWNAKVESCVDSPQSNALILIGLATSKPSVLFSKNEPEFDVPSNLLVVTLLSNENESWNMIPLSLIPEKSVELSVTLGLLPIALVPEK